MVWFGYCPECEGERSLSVVDVQMPSEQREDVWDTDQMTLPLGKIPVSRMPVVPVGYVRLRLRCAPPPCQLLDKSSITPHEFYRVIPTQEWGNLCSSPCHHSSH